MFGVVSTRCPPGFRIRLISAIMCIGIFGQMLHQLAAQDRGEIAVVVRKAVLFGVEEIHVAMELLARRWSVTVRWSTLPAGP